MCFSLWCLYDQVFILNIVYVVFGMFNDAVLFFNELDNQLLYYNVYFYLVYMSLFLYGLGLFGLLFNVKNIFISLLFVEIVYFGVISYFLTIGLIFDCAVSFSYALLLILIAAAESVVGLGLVIVIFRNQRKITYNNFISLRI